VPGPYLDDSMQLRVARQGGATRRTRFPDPCGGTSRECTWPPGKSLRLQGRVFADELL